MTRLCSTTLAISRRRKSSSGTEILGQMADPDTQSKLSHLLWEQPRTEAEELWPQLLLGSTPIHRKLTHIKRRAVFDTFKIPPHHMLQVPIRTPHLNSNGTARISNTLHRMFTATGRRIARKSSAENTETRDGGGLKTALSASPELAEM